MLVVLLSYGVWGADVSPTAFAFSTFRNTLSNQFDGLSPIKGFQKDSSKLGDSMDVLLNTLNIQLKDLDGRYQQLDQINQAMDQKKEELEALVKELEAKQGDHQAKSEELEAVKKKLSELTQESVSMVEHVKKLQEEISGVAADNSSMQLEVQSMRTKYQNVLLKAKTNAQVNQALFEEFVNRGEKMIEVVKKNVQDQELIKNVKFAVVEELKNAQTLLSQCQIDHEIINAGKIG